MQMEVWQGEGVGVGFVLGFPMGSLCVWQVGEILDLLDRVFVPWEVSPSRVAGVTQGMEV